MEIRKASRNDAEGIAKVQVDSWRFAYKDIIDEQMLASLNIASKTRSWERILGEDAWPAFVAVDDTSSINGFVHICKYRDDDLTGHRVGEVSAIYIYSDRVGTGIGALLFQQALTQLASFGFDKVAVWVLEKNQPAINFYRKFDFRPDGGRKVHQATGLVEVRYVSSQTRIPEH